MEVGEPGEGFIPKYGGYRNLRSYQKAEIVYDGTVYFTRRFLDKYDRTVGQMVQAARSGKQNIAEGSMASGVSKETEIRLTGVARASLEELLLDYEDYLRTNKLLLWGKDHRLVLRLKELNQSVTTPSYDTFRKAIENSNSEICANTMITLIHFTTYLLNRQIRTLEAQFIEGGGVREKMAEARSKFKNNNKK
jgi:four helix bundle suffix protein